MAENTSCLSADASADIYVALGGVPGHCYIGRIRGRQGTVGDVAQTASEGSYFRLKDTVKGKNVVVVLYRGVK